MKAFLSGLGLGFGLGVLFAPMRGQDAREMLAVRASELADNARNQYEKAWEKTDAAITAIRGDQDKTTRELA